MAATMSFAQDRTVSGQITSSEDGSTLPGVNVVVKGTTQGGVTDIDGNYKITVPEDGGTLVFSFIGLETQEVEIGSRSIIDMQMASDIKQLGEVVITGYRSYTKEKSNISVVTVNSEAIELRPNASVIQTLSGQVAGLNITTSSGQPGGNAVVNIRGVGSINGETEPLFIIDGTPVDGDNFRSLNPNEIASISVLKDAGATAIYGNRGANGVIVIETKNGSYNSPLEITYSYLRSSSTLQKNNYNLMNSQEQLRLEREMGVGRGDTLSDAEIDAFATTDWAEHFFNQGVANSHNIQLSKGGENTSAYFSFGYWDQEGILQSSSLKRYNVRSNVTGKSDDNKFNFALNLSINYSDSEEPNSIGSGAINRNYVLGAYQSVPYISPDDYTNGADLTSPLLFANTPLFLMDRLETYTRTENELKLLGTLRLSYEIIDGLTISSRTSADLQNVNLIRAEGPTSFNAILFAETGNNTPGFQDQQFTRQFALNQVTSITYDRSFGEHNFNLGLYTEYFKADLYTFGFRQRGLNAKTFFPGDGSGFVADNSANDFFKDDANANILSSGLFSYFGQLDYDYASRFGLTGTIRRDASSRFAQTNRWGTFFAVAGRWNIHNEAFASGLPFNALKLRASYGTNGNQNIQGGGYFTALDLYRPLYRFAGGYGGANSLRLDQIPINTLKWETIGQVNIGLDAELFDGRLRSTIEVYSKVTKDLFLELPVSSITGETVVNGNFGELKNSGVDFLVAYDVIRSNDLTITVDVLGNYNKQEILELPGGVDQINGIGRVGGKLLEYFDYRYAGVNPSNGNMLFLTASGEVTEDPNIDTDRVWLDKNIYPDIQGSFGLSADYKGFYVSARFNYTMGVDRYDFDLAGFQDPTAVGQFRNTRDILRAWTPTNRETDIPALRASNINLDGTRFLRSSDYIRLRFLNVGYNIPKKYMEAIKLRSGRVFATAENLVTFTRWRGFDAESINSTANRYPTPRTISVGFELGF